MYYEDILLNKDVKFNEKKRRAKEDGFYALYLCDFEKGSRGLLKSIDLPNGQSICVGKSMNGIMYEFMTNKKIDFVDDIDVIYDKGEEFYYFEKPCYVNVKKLSIGEVAIFVSLFENDVNFIKSYMDVLNEQFRHAISGYKQMRGGIDKYYRHKVKKL